MDHQSKLIDFKAKMILPKKIINKNIEKIHDKFCNIKIKFISKIKILIKILIIKYRYHIIKGIMRTNKSTIKNIILVIGFTIDTMIYEFKLKGKK